MAWSGVASSGQSTLDHSSWDLWEAVATVTLAVLSVLGDSLLTSGRRVLPLGRIPLERFPCSLVLDAGLARSGLAGLDLAGLDQCARFVFLRFSFF